MAQARVLADLAGEALDLEGRRLGVGEQLGARSTLSSTSPVGSSGLTVSAERRTTVAGGAQHVLGAQLVGELEGLAGAVGVEDELDDAGAVAQVDEDQAAVVAAAVDPAGDPRLGVDPVAEHLAAPGVAVGVGRAAAGASLMPLLRSSRRQGCRYRPARCSPLSMSRSCGAAVGLEDQRRGAAPIRSACLSWPLRLRPARSSSAESPAWRSSTASAIARCRWPASATATKTSRPAGSSSSSSASRIRSIPAAQPTAGVAGPPSCSIRPS